MIVIYKEVNWAFSNLLFRSYACSEIDDAVLVNIDSIRSNSYLDNFSAVKNSTLLFIRLFLSAEWKRWLISFKFGNIPIGRAVCQTVLRCPSSRGVICRNITLLKWVFLYFRQAKSDFRLLNRFPVSEKLFLYLPESTREDLVTKSIAEGFPNIDFIEYDINERSFVICKKFKSYNPIRRYDSIDNNFKKHTIRKLIDRTSGIGSGHTLTLPEADQSDISSSLKLGYNSRFNLFKSICYYPMHLTSDDQLTIPNDCFLDVDSFNQEIIDMFSSKFVGSALLLKPHPFAFSYRWPDKRDIELRYLTYIIKLLFDNSSFDPRQLNSLDGIMWSSKFPNIGMLNPRLPIRSVLSSFNHHKFFVLTKHSNIAIESSTVGVPTFISRFSRFSNFNFCHTFDSLGDLEKKIRLLLLDQLEESHHDSPEFVASCQALFNSCSQSAMTVKYLSKYADLTKQTRESFQRSSDIVNADHYGKLSDVWRRWISLQ